MNGNRRNYRRKEVDAHATFDAATSETVIVWKRTDGPEIVFQIALAKIHSLIHLPKIEKSDLERICCHQQRTTRLEQWDALLFAENVEGVGFHLLRSNRLFSRTTP